MIGLHTNGEAIRDTVVTRVIKKLLIFPPILVGIAALVFMTAQRSEPAKHPPQERAISVRVIEATPLKFVSRVSGFGSVYPGTVWTLVAQVAGEVEYVHPAVKKGEILPGETEIVRLSPVDYELAIAQANANIRSAQTQLAEFDITEKNLQSLIALEKDGLAVREAEYERQKDLFEKGTLAKASLDLVLRETLAQRTKIQDLENSLQLLPTQRAVQREQIAVYQAQLNSAKLDLGRTRISLPIDARIAEVNVEVGQFVQAGTTLVVADSIDVAEVEAQIPLAHFRHVIQASVGDLELVGITPETVSRFIDEIGFDVVVRVRSGDQSIAWPGKYARISDAINAGTRTVGVVVAVEGAYANAVPGKRPPLAKGMFAEVELRASNAIERIVVPRSAIRDGRVYVASPESDSRARLQVREVQIGAVQDDIATILSGIDSGEKVVVSDLTAVVDGMLLSTQDDDDLQRALEIQAAGAPGGQ